MTVGTQGDPAGGSGQTIGTTIGTIDYPHGGTTGTTTGTINGIFEWTDGATIGESGGADEYGEGGPGEYGSTGGTFVAISGTADGGGALTGTTSGATAGSDDDTTEGPTHGSDPAMTEGSSTGNTTGTTIDEPTDGTFGSSDGPSTGGTFDPMEPPELSIAGLWAGMFDDGNNGNWPLEMVREGSDLRVTGWIDGAVETDQIPSLAIFVDTNFDGDFDDEGEVVRFNAAENFGQSPAYDDWSAFDALFYIRDDGPTETSPGQPGNHTPSDDIKVRVEFMDEVIELTPKAYNVAPRFLERPSVERTTKPDGTEQLTVTSLFQDPGLWDRHHVTVTWADGTTSDVTDHETTLDPETLKYVPSTRKTIHVTGPAPPKEQPMYPIIVTVHDDDTGKTKYTITPAVVTRNNDDDDQNEIDDMLDGGFAKEDDLVQLNLSPLTSNQTSSPSTTTPLDTSNAPDGHYYLGYDTAKIKLWDSPEKLNQYLPGDQKKSANPYTAKADVWMEGIGIGKTRINLSWLPDNCDDKNLECQETQPQLLGHVDTLVWGIDVDIDSDNNNEFNYPDNSDWEEELEANKYAIGKMLSVGAPHFTPVRIRLPTDLHSTTELITLTLVKAGRDSGEILLWRKPKHDWTRIDEEFRKGGDRLNPNATYTLHDLGYDPDTGGIVLFLESQKVVPDHAALVGNDSSVEGVDDYGKPDTRLRASLKGLDLKYVDDEVKWMIVEPNSFYPTVNANADLRSAFAAQIVYGFKDPRPGTFGPGGAEPLDEAPEYALRRLSIKEVSELIADLNDELQRYITDNLFQISPTVERPSFYVSDMQAALYRDYVSGRYILAFAGTENLADWIDNLSQAITPGNEQYVAAMYLAARLALSESFTPDNLHITGQSLGGGLASAASLASEFHATTFNAAGLEPHTLHKTSLKGGLIGEGVIPAVPGGVLLLGG